MGKKRQKINILRVRQNANYTIQDISSLLGVHKHTVREWLRKGLPKIDDQKPFLIHGRELKNFLQSRRKARRRKCSLDEFYCLRCRAPRHAMGRLADVVQRNEKSLMVSALCEICSTPIHKIQSLKNLPKLFQVFDISKQHQKRLSECLPLSLNCDFMEEIRS